MATTLPPQWRIHSYDAFAPSVLESPTPKSDAAWSSDFVEQPLALLEIGNPTTVPKRAARSHESLSARLASVLQQGAESVNGAAAAFYVLNDETTHLELRASWGLSEDALLYSARELPTAIADLEALVGHTVAINDTENASYWNIPHVYPSAICTPIATDSQLLGTFWVFADNKREFSDSESNVVEIVAGRLAAELDRASLLRDRQRARRSDLQIETAADWRSDRLPQVAAVEKGWSIHGWSSPVNKLRGDFYDWVCGDDSTVLLIGDTHSHTIEGSLEFATLQSTSRIFAGQSLGAHDVLQQTNQALWSGSSRGQAATLGVLQFAPQTGMYEFASAGSMQLLRVSPCHTDQQAIETELLGSDSYIECESNAGALAVGESLLLMTEGLTAIFEQHSDAFAKLQEAVSCFSNWREVHAWLDRWYIELGDKAPLGSLVMLRREHL